MESGIIVFLVLALMGGAIAFVGDKLGTKVGKRRISLWGMRPKHTSILVTIVTGILIALMTIGVMSVLSENVRVALFGMEELRMKMTNLTSEVDEKSKALDASKQLLAERTKEYDSVTVRLQDANADLARTESQRDYIQRQLFMVEAAYDKAKADVQASAAEIESLEKTRNELNENIAKLNNEAERLRTGIIAVREGHVMFRVGEVLSSAVVDKGLSVEQTRLVLASVLNDTNNLLVDRLELPKDKMAVQVTADRFEKAVQALSNSVGKKWVRVVAAGNIIVGEPAWVDFVVYDDRTVYHKGETILEKDLADYQDIAALEARVLRFLKEVNEAATKNGVVPDPITGNVGQVNGQQLFHTMELVQQYNGRVVLEAVAKNDISTEGPVHIDIVVHPIK